MKLDEEVSQLAGIGRTTAKNLIRDTKILMGITSTDYSESTRGQLLKRIKDGGLIVSVTGDSEPEEIRDAGNFHGKQASDHWQMFCLCVVALRDHCEMKRGGSDFSALAKEYWNLSSGQASECLSVGRAVPYFSEFRGVVPSSKSAQIALAKLPEQTFIEHAEAGDIKPDMTAKQAKALNTPKPQPQTAQQPRGDVPPPSDPDAIEVTFEELEDDGSDSVTEALADVGIDRDVDPNTLGIVDISRRTKACRLDGKLKGLNATQKRAVRAYIKEEVLQQVTEQVDEGVKKDRERLGQIIEEYGGRIGQNDKDIMRVTRCLHSDTRRSRSDEQFDLAYQAFIRLIGFKERSA